MSENIAPWILFITLGLIWYYKEGYLPNKKNALLYKIKLLYENNSEIRNVFISFENEQKNSKNNHPDFNGGNFNNISKPGILNKDIEIYGIPVYVFYEYQAEDFKLDLMKRIKRIESTKKGKREIKELIKKHNW